MCKEHQLFFLQYCRDMISDSTAQQIQSIAVDIFWLLSSWGEKKILILQQFYSKIHALSVFLSFFSLNKVKFHWYIRVFVFV